MVVWSTDKPLGHELFHVPGRLKENRRYHRTQVTMISAANYLFRNRDVWQTFIRSRYQTAALEVATLALELLDERPSRQSRTQFSSGWTRPGAEIREQGMVPRTVTGLTRFQTMITPAACHRYATGLNFPTGVTFGARPEPGSIAMPIGGLRLLGLIVRRSVPNLLLCAICAPFAS